MNRLYVIIGLCAVALTIVIAVSTCMITQPPVDNDGPAPLTHH
jgi:hypothetical protein